jgi:hypothetical protein
MQHWTLNFKRKSSVSHERVEALMVEFGYSWNPVEDEPGSTQQAEAPADDLALFWPMPDPRRVNIPLLLG